MPEETRLAWAQALADLELRADQRHAGQQVAGGVSAGALAGGALAAAALGCEVQ